MTGTDRVSGPYPYYGANGKQDSVANFIFDEALVLLAEDGGHFDNPNRGIAYRIQGKTWVNNHAHVLRPRPEIDGRYLCRVLENYDVSAFIAGTTRSKLTKGGASRIPVPVPPVEEQQRIAAILDHADALRAKRREALANLDVLPQSIFVFMFGDPVINPMKWPIRPLAELGGLDRGVSKYRPRNFPALLGGPYPLVQTGDVANSDGLIRNFKSTYSEVGLKQSKIWPAGTLCITIAANIAKTGVLTFDACFPDSVVGFSGPPSMTAYIRTWFTFLQKSIEQAAPESAQKNINLTILRGLPVPCPPQDRLDLFADRLNRLQATKDQCIASLVYLNNLFASLQTRAFAGQL